MIDEAVSSVKVRVRVSAYAVLPLEEGDSIVLGGIALIEAIDTVFAIREAGAADELRVKVLLGNGKDGWCTRLFA